jgi:tripartite-type tricarboxylate transporter receptor subunit TctC
MHLPRRQFLHLAAGAAALPVVSRVARAQAYPSRPVRFVVPFAAGGGSDIIARLLGQWLSERLGQPFIIENRPGAGGTVGTEVVVRASADGHTLLQIGTFNVINAAVYEKLSFDFIRDIMPVAGVVRVPGVMLVNPALSVRSVLEFIAYAKAHPGKINMASGGTGGFSHAFGELFKMRAGVELLHVPYRGVGPALTDLLGGQVQVMFDTLPQSIEHIRSGKLRALAVTTATRVPLLPQVPTVGELVPGYEATAFQGIGTPKNTSAEIIGRLNKEINAGLVNAKLNARLGELGGMTLPGSVEEFGKFIAGEAEKWAEVVKFAKIRPEK